MQAYEKVKLARDIDRISTKDVIQYLTDSFVECHGDRLSKEDRAIIGGVGLLNDDPITIIGHEKGREPAEHMSRNFGSSGPAGYRKAQRLMKQAEKFNRPILTLINTAGADATPEAEEGGVGEAIAQTIFLMSSLKVPTLAIILGEGGSGGAIALAVADEVWIMEHSVYSILSPEGFASILWKDASKAKKAADLMKLTASDLKDMQIVERIIQETTANGEKIPKSRVLDDLKENILTFLKEAKNVSVDERLLRRTNRYRNY